MYDADLNYSQGSLYSQDLVVDKENCEVVVFNDRILLAWNNKQNVYLWKDVIGSYQVSSAKAVLICFLLSNLNKPIVKHEIFYEGIETIIKIIQSMCNHGKMPYKNETVFRKRYKVIINPKSGRGKAIKIWTQVSILFEVCDLDTQYTEYQGHCTEIISNLNYEMYDGVIIVSGDGLIHEAINAMYSSSNKNLKKISLSIIPAGTGNALAQLICANINQPVKPEVCAYITIKGREVPLDISKVIFSSGKIVYSFLSLAWGFIADVDIKSEVCRCCGPFRYDLYGLWRVLFLKRYEGIINWTGNLNTRYSGPVVYFMACNLPYISIGRKIAPLSKHDDGTNDLLLMGNVSRIPLIRVLLRQDSGNHLSSDRLEYIKTSKWNLDPKGGIYSIDGEFYNAEPIEVEVLPSFGSIVMLD
jgi:sphingosine kinase